MTNDEFFEKYQSESSSVILGLDANDDQSEFCYNALLYYRELPFVECQTLFSEEDEMSEEAFVEWVIDELDWIIIRARNAKKLLKKRKKTIKEELM